MKKESKRFGWCPLCRRKTQIAWTEKVQTRQLVCCARCSMVFDKAVAEETRPRCIVCRRAFDEVGDDYLSIFTIGKNEKCKLCKDGAKEPPAVSGSRV